MTKVVLGRICGQEKTLTGEFVTDQGLLLDATLTLTTSVDDLIFGPAAIHEYDSIDTLRGEFRIGSGSVFGPNELHLLLMSHSGVKAKITGRIFPPLSSALNEDGGSVLFKQRDEI